MLLQALAIPGIRLYFLACPFIGFNLVTATYLISTEHPRPAQIISVSRGILVLIPMAFLLSAIFGLTVSGVLIRSRKHPLPLWHLLYTEKPPGKFLYFKIIQAAVLHLFFVKRQLHTLKFFTDYIFKLKYFFFYFLYYQFKIII